MVKPRGSYKSHYYDRMTRRWGQGKKREHVPSLFDPAARLTFNSQMKHYICKDDAYDKAF